MRINCVICGSDSLVQIYSFKNFPIYMGISSSEDEFADQVWGACIRCGCIQLLELIDLKKLYQRPHNPAIGRTWAKHHEDFAEFCGISGKVLEIGGGNMKLARLLAKRCNSYTVYDKGVRTEDIPEGVTVVNNFFSPEIKMAKEKYDFIIASHMIEHMYNPVDYFSKFAYALKKDGQMVFSYPNITNGIADCNNNALNFEHTYQLDLNYLQRLLNSNNINFALNKYVAYNRYNDFVSFKRSNKIVQDTTNRLSDNINLWNTYIKQNKLIASYLCNRFHYCQNIFLFGCHVFSQYMLEFGLKELEITGILDNDPDKQGKCLYGTNLIVSSPEVLKSLVSPIVIVRAGIYQQEICDQIKNINRSCVIV